MVESASTVAAAKALLRKAFDFATSAAVLSVTVSVKVAVLKEAPVALRVVIVYI